MLSKEQTNWIFYKCKQLVDKYLKSFPSTDEEWEQFHKDILLLSEKTKKDKLCEETLLAICNYFDYLYKMREEENNATRK